MIKPIFAFNWWSRWSYAKVPSAGGAVLLGTLLQLFIVNKTREHWWNPGQAGTTFSAICKSSQDYIFSLAWTGFWSCRKHIMGLWGRKWTCTEAGLWRLRRKIIISKILLTQIFQNLYSEIARTQKRRIAILYLDFERRNTYDYFSGYR